jgi:hypothetical protein
MSHYSVVEGLMLVLSQENQAVDRVASVIWKQVERGNATIIVRLFGRLVAYLPQAKRAYYIWLVAFSYMSAQYTTPYHFSPAELRARFFGRWEFGLILGHWLLGLRSGHPPLWLKRV